MSPSDRERYSVIGFLRPYRLRLFIVLIIMAAGAFLGLLNPWFLEQLIDNIILAKRFDLLWLFATAVLGAAVMRFSLGLVQSFLYAQVTSHVLLDMRRDFLEHLQKLSMRFFTGTRFGEITSRFNRDLSQVQEIATGTLLRFITTVFTLAGTVGFALYYNWLLFLIGAVPFPVALVLAQRFRSPLRRITRRLRETAAELASFVIESISGIRTIRALGQERRELARFTEKGGNLIRGILSFQVTSSLAGGLPRLLLVTSTIAVYAVGAIWVMENQMQLGDLIAMGMYMGMVYTPIATLIDLYLKLVGGRVALERVREVRELKPEVSEDPLALVPEAIQGHIHFDQVCFHYEPRNPVLNQVSFDIEAGETVALVGRSGAGKSTIVDLLFRFYDPVSGSICIDDYDVREIRMSRVRDRMAVVSQETFLFHDTLFENLRFGAPGAGEEEVRSVAAIAGIDELLPSLPQGYETVIGERGSRLSGGERQRISVARALLRRPTILILDEATSSLDYASDRAIRAGIDQLKGPATTLIITHRLGHLNDVNRVLVLDDGRIVQSGPPLELASKAGPYRKLLAEERAHL